MASDRNKPPTTKSSTSQKDHPALEAMRKSDDAIRAKAQSALRYASGNPKKAMKMADEITADHPSSFLALKCRYDILRKLASFYPDGRLVGLKDALASSLVYSREALEARKEVQSVGGGGTTSPGELLSAATETGVGSGILTGPIREDLSPLQDDDKMTSCSSSSSSSSRKNRRGKSLDTEQQLHTIEKFPHAQYWDGMDTSKRNTFLKVTYHQIRQFYSRKAPSATWPPSLNNAVLVQFSRGKWVVWRCPCCYVIFEDVEPLRIHIISSHLPVVGDDLVSDLELEMLLQWEPEPWSNSLVRPSSFCQKDNFLEAIWEAMLCLQKLGGFSIALLKTINDFCMQWNKEQSLMLIEQQEYSKLCIISAMECQQLLEIRNMLEELVLECDLLSQEPGPKAQQENEKTPERVSVTCSSPGVFSVTNSNGPSNDEDIFFWMYWGSPSVDFLHQLEDQYRKRMSHISIVVEKLQVAFNRRSELLAIDPPIQPMKLNNELAITELHVKLMSAKVHRLIEYDLRHGCNIDFHGVMLSLMRGFLKDKLSKEDAYSE